MGSFCSSKPQTTTYTPPPAVTKGYEQLLSFATPLLKKPYEAYQGPLVAGMSPYEQAAGQGIAGLFGGTEPYFGTAAGMAIQGSQPVQQMQFTPQAVQQYLSPYLQNVMGTTAQNIMETNAQQQNQILGNSIQRGAFGGDRARIAQAELARQQNLANNATLANIANQGYSQALGMFNQQQQVDLARQIQSGQLAQSGANLLAQMGPAQQQAQLAQLGAQLGYGGLERQLGQAGLSTAYQQFLNQQQYPYNLANWFGGLMSGAASSLGGTTTTQAAQPSMFNQILGAGGALGAMGGSGGIGSALSGIGSILCIFGSDERLKDNIHHIGQTNDGQPLYSYTRKDDPQKHLHIGLMAHEVEHVKPEAVHDFGGIKAVDYQAALKEAAIPHMANGGVPGGVLGMSPIAGMQAQSYVPAPMQAQGGFKPPQQPQMADPNKDLEGMVKNIRSMMGTKPAQPQAAAPRQLGPQAPVGVEPVGTDTTNMTPEGTADLSNLYANGGTVNPFNFDYGLQTKEDLAQQAQSRAGTGMSGLSQQEEAEAASGILGAAHGGRIHLANGGPAETDVERQPLDLTKPIPQAPRQPDFLSYITPRESGGDPNARNPNSSASGLFQFTDATYRGVLARNPELEGASKNDPRVAEAHRKELARVLQSQGIEPNNQNLYMSWFLGAGGGSRFIKGMQENPNGPATALAQPDQVAANRSVFFNKDGSPRTASEVFNFLNRPMGGQGVAGAAPQAPQGVQQSQAATAQTTRVPASPEESRIPIQSRATKEGLFGMLGIEMTPEQRLAFIQASLKFAGTPGRPGVGLAAAADTYAKTLLEAQRSQREAASTQAGTEQTRAAAKREEQAAVSGQFIPGPGGYARFTATPEGGVKIEVPKMPAAGGETTVGPGGAAPTTVPGAPTAPQAPTTTGPAQTETEKRVFNFAPLHGGETAQQKLDVMRKMGEEIGQKAWGTNGPQLQKEYAEINAEAQREGKAATNSLNDLAALSKAISGLPASGPLTPGAASELRYQVANYINTFAKAFGVDAGVNGAMSSKEMLDKLGTLSTQAQQRGLGREAAVWLQTLSKAYPSAGMTADTARSLTADLIVANKKNMDRAQIYSLYGDYSNNAGRNAEDVFRAVIPGERYLQDKQAIEKILALRSPQGNPLTMLQNGQIKREAFDAYAKKYFGIENLSRYAFGG